MDRITNATLTDYLLSRELISPHQLGFFRKHSACSNLLENDWTLALDNHMRTDGTYVDFQKAFDSVLHSKLIAKLESYNTKGELLSWIKAFLSHRSQQVRIGILGSNV